MTQEQWDAFVASRWNATVEAGRQQAMRETATCQFCDEPAVVKADDGTPLCNDHWNATFCE